MAKASQSGLRQLKHPPHPRDGEPRPVAPPPPLAPRPRACRTRRRAQSWLGVHRRRAGPLVPPHLSLSCPIAHGSPGVTHVSMCARVRNTSASCRQPAWHALRTWPHTTSSHNLPPDMHPATFARVCAPIPARLPIQRHVPFSSLSHRRAVDAEASHRPSSRARSRCVAPIEEERSFAPLLAPLLTITTSCDRRKRNA